MASLTQRTKEFLFGMFGDHTAANELISNVESGGGSVTGPNSSTAHNITAFADTSGAVLEDSGLATTAVVTRTGTQTLTNKTLTAPVISTISNTGTLTLPTSTDTLVGKATTDTLTNKTLTAPVISTISNSGTLTLPTSTDTLVGKATTDTLTNKTLTSPVISSISNTGTLTLPTSTDTLVGRATTDTLTNKTLTSPVLATPSISSYENFTQITTPATPASGHNALYFKSNDHLYLKTSGGTETQVDGGSAFDPQFGSYNATGAINLTSGGDVIKFNNRVQDANSAYNTSTGIFTAPSTGTWRFVADINVNSVTGIANADFYDIAWLVNKSGSGYTNAESGETYFVPSSAHAAGGQVLMHFETIIDLTAGDLGFLQWVCSQTTQLFVLAKHNRLYFHKIG